MYCWYQFFLLAVPMQTEAAKNLYQQYRSVLTIFAFFAKNITTTKSNA